MTTATLKVLEDMAKNNGSGITDKQGSAYDDGYSESRDCATIIKRRQNGDKLISLIKVL